MTQDMLFDLVVGSIRCRCQRNRLITGVRCSTKVIAVIREQLQLPRRLITRRHRQVGLPHHCPGDRQRVSLHLDRDEPLVHYPGGAYRRI